MPQQPATPPPPAVPELEPISDAELDQLLDRVFGEQAPQEPPVQPSHALKPQPLATPPVDQPE